MPGAVIAATIVEPSEKNPTTEGVAKINGFVVFVKGATTVGQAVNVRITERGRTIAIGEVTTDPVTAAPAPAAAPAVAPAAPVATPVEAPAPLTPVPAPAVAPAAPAEAPAPVAPAVAEPMPAAEEAAAEATPAAPEAPAAP